MYADCFIIPIPKKGVPAYKKLATLGKKVWMEHGALDYKECVADDLNTHCGLPFNKLANLKRTESVIFAWITFKSKAHRDRVNAKVMNDPRLTSISTDSMPFDVERMSYGGFKVLVGTK